MVRELKKNSAKSVRKEDVSEINTEDFKEQASSS